MKKDTQTKHTPGPWFIVGWEIHDRTTYFNTHGVRTGETPNSICALHPMPCDNVDANARLIAAAPELLEALEHFIAFYSDENSNVYKGSMPVFLRGVRNEARAAIAKAKGENA